MKNIVARLICIHAVVVAIGCGDTSAAVERYKDESLYLARLAELGYVGLQEDFEGSAWDGIRATIANPAYAASITNKQLQWDSISGSLYPYQCNPTLLATNTNWARSGYGIYDNCIATTLRVIAPEPIFGIGFWVDTNPDGQDVGILFPGRSAVNEPGYLVSGHGAMYPGDIHPVGHSFVGFIDPGGFTEVVITGTLELNEESQLEGATTYGADDFTFAVDSEFLPTPLEAWRAAHFAEVDLVNPAKETSVWGNGADPDRDGLINEAEFALGTGPNDPSDGDGGVVAGVVHEAGHPLLTLTFQRRNDDPDLSVSPQRSDDGTAWSSGPAQFQTTFALDQGNGYDLVTVKERAATAPRPNSLARLLITRISPP